MIIDLNEVKQIDSLEVKYGDESYMFPLGNHLPLKRLKALKTDDDITVALFYLLKCNYRSQ